MADKANKKGGAPKPPRVPVRALGAAAGALAVAGGIGWLGLNSFFTGMSAARVVQSLIRVMHGLFPQSRVVIVESSSTAGVESKTKCTMRG